MSTYTRVKWTLLVELGSRQLRSWLLTSASRKASPGVLREFFFMRSESDQGSGRNRKSGGCCLLLDSGSVHHFDGCSFFSYAFSFILIKLEWRKLVFLGKCDFASEGGSSL